MTRWGLLILIILDVHAMQHHVRVNGKPVSEEDMAHATDFVKRNRSYEVSINEVVAVLLNERWIYAQVIFQPSRLNKHTALLGRSKTLKFNKNWVVDFQAKRVKKLQNEINEANA